MRKSKREALVEKKFFDKKLGCMRTIFVPEDAPESTWIKDYHFHSMKTRLDGAGNEYFKSFAESRDSK